MVHRWRAEERENVPSTTTGTFEGTYPLDAISAKATADYSLHRARIRNESGLKATLEGPGGLERQRIALSGYHAVSF